MFVVWTDVQSENEMSVCGNMVTGHSISVEHLSKTSEILDQPLLDAIFTGHYTCKMESFEIQCVTNVFPNSHLWLHAALYCTACNVPPVWWLLDYGEDAQTPSCQCWLKFTFDTALKSAFFIIMYCCNNQATCRIFFSSEKSFDVYMGSWL